MPTHAVIITYKIGCYGGVLAWREELFNYNITDPAEF